MTLSDECMTALADGNVEAAISLIEQLPDLNDRCDEGCSVIYGAILEANVAIVRLLLEKGADPNLEAYEPAAIIYAEHPLDLAKQCRFLLDWDRYNPIVALLKEFGATETNSAGVPDVEI